MTFSYVLIAFIGLGFIFNIIFKNYIGILTSLLGIIYLCLYIFKAMVVIELAWAWFAVVSLSVLINLFLGGKGLALICATIPEIVYLCITLF